MVEVDSSSPYTINATENYTCVCKASGGRRPINVTWFKGKEQIRESRKGEQTLRLNNVGRDHNGTYRCEAKSHDTAINITEIELIVNCEYLTWSNKKLHILKPTYCISPMKKSSLLYLMIVPPSP
jgi:hypothetical protein